MLGDILRAVGRRVADRHAELRGRLDGDLVVADAPAHDEPALPAAPP